jgi:hypothetical protein
MSNPVVSLGQQALVTKGQKVETPAATKIKAKLMWHSATLEDGVTYYWGYTIIRGESASLVTKIGLYSTPFDDVADRLLHAHGEPSRRLFNFRSYRELVGRAKAELGCGVLLTPWRST